MASAFDSIRVRAEQHGLFETSILHGRLSDAGPMTEALEAAIRARMAEDPGLDRSNVGGWHSRTDMLDWGGPAAAKLADIAVKMAKRMSHFDGAEPLWSVRMWANVSPPGALNMSHAHPGVLWAAVYYVAAGEADAGGELYLEDPRFPVPQMTLPGFRAIGADGVPQNVDHRIAPQRGDLILFPAWMRHGVRPCRGSGERISIAMNLYVREPQAQTESGAQPKPQADPEG
jgi:uncharacterized protein (TIGR02466 family)